MSTDVLILSANAAALGLFHTVIGPDHYLPFIVLARAQGWRTRRTVLITILCGLAHVASSIALGFAGLGLGVALERLELIESFRGNLTAWLLIGFGLVYGAWGLRQATRRPKHAHAHGTQHVHRHRGVIGHTHHREAEEDHDDHPPHHGDEPAVPLTPWILFTVFVFGPCEPLIPLFIYPAANHGWASAALVTSLFAIATIGTMLVFVVAGLHGLRQISAQRYARYGHAAAGLSIALAGGAIQLLGV